VWVVSFSGDGVIPNWSWILGALATHPTRGFAGGLKKGCFENHARSLPQVGILQPMHAFQILWQ
jgi:hypothetical protein